METEREESNVEVKESGMCEPEFVEWDYGMGIGADLCEMNFRQDLREKERTNK